MSRLIFLFVVIAVVYWLLKSYRKPSPKQDVPAASEDMVRCARCGVHLPKSEATLSAGKFFCGEAHRREHESN